VVKYTGSKYFYRTVRIESSSVKKRSSLAPKNYNKKTKKKIWRSKGRAVLMTSGLETGQQAPDASMQCNEVLMQPADRKAKGTHATQSNRVSSHPSSVQGRAQHGCVLSGDHPSSTHTPEQQRGVTSLRLITPRSTGHTAAHVKQYFV
jgi:hypothetical protein